MKSRPDLINNWIQAHRLRIDYFIHNIKGKSLQLKYNYSEDKCLAIINNKTAKIINIDIYKNNFIRFETVTGLIFENEKVISKRCHYCNKYFHPEDFYSDTDWKCSHCTYQYKKDWASKNKAKIKEKNRKHYLNNRTKILVYVKSHTDKVKKKEYDYNRYHKDIEAGRKRNRESYYRNKESYRIRARIYTRKKYKEDIIYKLKIRVSCEISRNLLKNHSSKNRKSILNYLNYSMKDLKTHLESQFEPWMTWDNWGVYRVENWNNNDSSTWKWQIDHIIPQSNFKYTTMDCQEFRDCWAFSNLRPLRADINILEGAKRTRHLKNDDI
jgi:hypothetical protein